MSWVSIFVSRHLRTTVLVPPAGVESRGIIGPASNMKRKEKPVCTPSAMRT